MKTLKYHYDGVGNLASESTPQSGYSNTYNEAGHLVTVTPSWNVDANHPGTLVTAHYSPNGGWLLASFGNGVNETYSYQPRWLTGMQVANTNCIIYGYTL